MRTVFRLVSILVCSAFVLGCGTYSRTYTYGPPPVPEPPAMPKAELPEPPAAPKMELPDPPTPPSPGLQPKPELIRVDSSGMTDIDITTVTVTLGEFTYAIGADGSWRLVAAPMGVQPSVVEFSIKLR